MYTMDLYKTKSKMKMKQKYTTLPSLHIIYVYLLF